MKRIYILIPLILILVGACGKASPEKRMGKAIVHIHTSVAPEILQTKAPITGSTFPDKGTYGIFICDHESSTVAHKSNSWNIRAQYTEDGNIWAYNYVNDISTGAVTSTSYENITLTSKDEVTADLYAYAPYTRSAYASGPTAIPYRIASAIQDQTDLMYAIENLTGSNANLNPSSAEDINAYFTFRHAFALLAFKFRLRNPGTYYSLTNTTLTLNDPDDDGITTAKIYSSGSFNALNGSFNHGEDDEVLVESLNVGQYNIVIQSQASTITALMIIVPTQVEDDELVFTFTVDGHTLQPFYLKKEQLLHDDGITYGFQSGFRYNFNFILDNYLYFDGFTIDSSWTPEILGSQDI